MMRAISLPFITLIIWPSFSVKLASTIKALVKEALNFLHNFAMAFSNLSSPVEKPKHM